MTASNNSPQLKHLSNKQDEKSPEPNIHLKITAWLINITNSRDTG